MERLINILIIDDIPKDQSALKEILGGGGNILLFCNTIAEADELLNRREVGIILINVDSEQFSSMDDFKDLLSKHSNKSHYSIIITEYYNNQQLFVLGDKSIFFPKYSPEHLYIVAELKYPFKVRNIILTNDNVLFISTDNDLWIIGETPLLFISPEIPTIFSTVTKLETPKIKELYYDGLNSLILDINNQIWIASAKIENINTIKLFTPELMYNKDNIFRYTLFTCAAKNSFIES